MLDENAAAKVASLVASAKTVAAVVNLARADSRHATAPEDWDADPWALNTPDGIIDLSNGQMRPHDRAALCSKMTAVAPAGSDCPRWQRFLHQVTDGEAELTSFLRRIAGYGLTGSTCEHALFFLNGTGANGMHDAGRDFQAAFILAQLDPLRALPVLRVPGTGRERT